MMWTTFEGTLQKVLASLSFVVIVIVAFINTVGMKSDRIAKLLWRHYNCGNAEEWFVDFLVGKGIVEP